MYSGRSQKAHDLGWALISLAQDGTIAHIPHGD